MFIDSDAMPSPDLLDRYFSPAPAERTGLIGGGVRDEEAPAGASVVTRYAYLRGAMSQDDTFDFGEWGYPKTANVACRRAAFEEVGGFRQEARAAEDADLTYRLRAAGWEVERREDAAVVHASRTTLRGFLKQKAVWGAGGAWLHSDLPRLGLAGRPGGVRALGAGRGPRGAGRRRPQARSRRRDHGRPPPARGRSRGSSGGACSPTSGPCPTRRPGSGWG